MLSSADPGIGVDGMRIGNDEYEANERNCVFEVFWNSIT